MDILILNRRKFTEMYIHQSYSKSLRADIEPRITKHEEISSLENAPHFHKMQPKQVTSTKFFTL